MQIIELAIKCDRTGAQSGQIKTGFINQARIDGDQFRCLRRQGTGRFIDCAEVLAAGNMDHAAPPPLNIGPGILLAAISFVADRDHQQTRITADHIKVGKGRQIVAAVFVFG